MDSTTGPWLKGGEKRLEVALLCTDEFLLRRSCVLQRLEVGRHFSVGEMEPHGGRTESSAQLGGRWNDLG